MKTCTNFCEQCGDCFDCYGEDICAVAQIRHDEMNEAEKVIKMKDYEKIVEKMKSLGGLMLETFTNESEDFEPDKTIELWNLRGEAIIGMIYQDGDYGLYHFIGKNNEPVEKDIGFLENLVQKNLCICGHADEHHFNAGERNICGGGEWNGDLHSENGCKCDGFESKSVKNTLEEQFEFARRHGE